MKNKAFLHSIHARGLTVGKIAQIINSGRPHLTEVFNGNRSGIPTRRKILEAGILTEDEIAELGWNNVPHRTKSHVGLSEGRAE